MVNSKKYQPPGELVKNVTAICGAEGVAWLSELPLIVAVLEEKWEVESGPAFEKGEFNFVAPARAESLDAVLKVAPPYPTTEIFAEAEFLTKLDGNGAARLLKTDRDSRAILIERIRPGETMDIYFSEKPFGCVEPAIEVLKSILQPPPYPPADAQLFYNWHYRFQRSLETEFPREYASKALAVFDRLFQDDERTFHLHGDFHPGNIIRSGQSEFVVIDPKGLVGHVAYDISVFLNNLHWWQRGKDGLQANLFESARKFADAFAMSELELREAAFAGMVIGAWWKFDEMPEDYNNEVALADIWNV